MFLHRVCLAIGGMTVQELEARMGSGELSDWAEYWAVEPWGAVRDNMHFGMVLSLLSNALSKKGSKRLTIEDFMLRTKEQDRGRKTQTALGMLSALATKKPKD